MGKTQTHGENGGDVGVGNAREIDAINAHNAVANGKLAAPLCRRPGHNLFIRRYGSI